jgi:hypothetical protein
MTNFTSFNDFSGFVSDESSFGLGQTELYSDGYPVWDHCSLFEDLSHDDRVFLCGFNPFNNGCPHPNCVMDSEEAVGRQLDAYIIHLAITSVMSFLIACDRIRLTYDPQKLTFLFLFNHFSYGLLFNVAWIFYLALQCLMNGFRWLIGDVKPQGGFVLLGLGGPCISLRQQLRRLPKAKKKRPHWTDRTPFSMFDTDPDPNDDVPWYFLAWFIGYLLVLIAGNPTSLLYIFPSFVIGYIVFVVCRLFLCLLPKLTRFKPHAALEPLNDMPTYDEMMAMFADYEQIAQDLSHEVHRDWYSYVLHDIPTAAMRYWNNWRYRMIQKSVPLLIPQAKPELNSKEAATASHEKHKKGRLNRKEQKKRVALATKRVLEEVKKRKIEPHAEDSSFVEFARPWPCERCYAHSTSG